MCGICGYISSKSIDEDTLILMNNSMYHRGPDDSGAIQFNNNHIGLAHRRLSIIDLSPQGHQPMFSSDGMKIVVFNGEIYNYTELKQELICANFRFKSNSDTEILLAAYEYWGFNCVDKLSGMFSFVIYDMNKNILFGARDRFGKKPLYYYHVETEFVFSSELKPIMLYPFFKKELNTSVLGRYLCNGYILPPDRIFKSTHQLPPGHKFIFSDDKLEISCYWNPVTAYKSHSKELIFDFQEAKNALKGVINSSVKQRLISDVPLGTFLSGGIDSTLITAIAQTNSSKPIKTYSIGFEEKEYDEACYAKRIAQYLGTEHHETYINEKMMLDLVDGIPEYYDEPFADSSQIPSMLVSKLARQDITVALSGDGGDELFCGYRSYDYVKIAKIFDDIRPICQIFLPLIKDKIHPYLHTILNNDVEAVKTQYHSGKYEKSIAALLIKPYTDLNYPIETEFAFSNWQLRRMLLDMQVYLPGDILTKVDRASMRYSLETRCPLLDHKVAEISFKIPHKFKYKNKTKKHILKEIVYDFVPRKLLDHPKKGFSVPIGRWLMGPLKSRLDQYCEKRFIERQGIFSYGGLMPILNNFFSSTNGDENSELLWRYFVFQIWYSRYCA